MRRTGSFILIVFMVLLLTNCNYQPLDTSEVDISWELISNTHNSNRARTIAEFKIINNSGFRFDDNNWALF